MPNTAHAYEHVQGIYLPIAVGVFVLVLGTLLVLLIAGRETQDAGAALAGARGWRWRMRASWRAWWRSCCG